MNEKRSDSKISMSRPAVGDGSTDRKKPYGKPEILSIEPLEAVAAACETNPEIPAQAGKHIACVQAQS
jgi:hypothetical protein